jgi:hypothetical protein
LSSSSDVSSSDDGDVHIVEAEDVLLGRALEGSWREHGNAEAFRRFMNRRLALGLAATGGLGRTGIDGNHLMAARHDLGEGRNREFGRSHEDDAHDAAYLLLVPLTQCYRDTSA